MCNFVITLYIVHGQHFKQSIFCSVFQSSPSFSNTRDIAGDDCLLSITVWEQWWGEVFFFKVTSASIRLFLIWSSSSLIQSEFWAPGWAPCIWQGLVWPYRGLFSTSSWYYNSKNIERILKLHANSKVGIVTDKQILCQNSLGQPGGHRIHIVMCITSKAAWSRHTITQRQYVWEDRI